MRCEHSEFIRGSIARNFVGVAEISGDGQLSSAQ
jgi:hypothetical protein